MRRFFIDTFYLIALSNRRDQWHRRVVTLSRALRDVRLYTVDEVLAEFLTFSSTWGVHLRTQAALDRFGRLDLLDNNVGIGSRGTVLDETEEHWRQAMQVNVDSMFRDCHAVDTAVSQAPAAERCLGSRVIRSPVRAARHRAAHHRTAPQCVAERVLVVVPSRSRMLPGPFELRRSDHDYRCPGSGGSHS